MKILITGANGQLGTQLEKKLKPFHTVFGLGKEELDITDKEITEKVISRIKPQIIIHTAAFTAVDQCEIDRKKAFEINSLGTGNIAKGANLVNARMVYISSDYVFDGTKMSPYLEENEPNPQSIYGISKWLGEKVVQNLYDGLIIRTSWLYGHDGNNFVKTMLKLAERQCEVKVVNDQIGSPTYVHDLTDTIIQLLSKKSGIYHASNSGSCSWYEFAVKIFEEAGYSSKLIKSITTEEYGSQAPRPKYSVLGNVALRRENLKVLRPWEEALKEFIREESNK